MGDWVARLLTGVAIVVIVAALFGLKLLVVSFLPPSPPETGLTLTLHMFVAVASIIFLVWLLRRK